MHEPSRQRLTRRALLTATGVGVLAAVAGCNPFSTGARTVTITAEATTTPPAPAPSVPILGLVATTRLHVQQLTAAIGVDKRDAAVFTMLLHDRQAHLTALETEYARNIGEQTPLKLPRGLNALWSRGGIQYSPPVR